ncbi:hypothetical protein GTW51_18955 [Aurantimonas aggregata]|uniref:Uncharacterized protein n=1 Tax=Aurantimonas aggregata TaxID=2047720 RepID=A0A6L9MMU9_9HYPH|nr:hypothetical protein [Aurantimonas aggregata]NDV88778.1 hypothetical protein [Aurantimonas aggregata]
MSAKKQRPQRGDPIAKDASERDISAITGMSRRKIWQAKKIAEIPEHEFERMVESDDPPTQPSGGGSPASQVEPPRAEDLPALRR